MANLYLVIDNTTNIIQSATSTSPPSILQTQYSVMVDDSITNAQEAKNGATNYAYQAGAIIRRPFFTLSYGAGSLVATLNSVPATVPTSCTIAICGATFTAAIVETTVDNLPVYSATLAVNVHVSVTSQVINVKVSATGCVDGTIDIGGSLTTAILECTDLTGGNTLTVMPVSKQYLAGYWAGAISPAYALADIATADSLAMDMSLALITWALALPAPYTFTWPKTGQSATYTDLQTNVAPNFVTTMADAMTDLHFAKYKTDMQAAKVALNGYTNDLATIPNLVD